MDPKFARMTGYMPMREEFETELYPGAERMVMDVSFSVISLFSSSSSQQSNP